MWTFLLANLLNPFAAIAKRIYAVFADNPAARMLLFAGILVASLVFGVNQCRQRANYENRLATANVKNDSLTTEIYAYQATQKNATTIKQARDEVRTNTLIQDSIQIARRNDAALKHQRDSLLSANRQYLRTRPKRRD